MRTATSNDRGQRSHGCKGQDRRGHPSPGSRLAEEVAETYDIVLSSPNSNYDFFAHRMREICEHLGLTFFMVDDVWVQEFLQKLQSGEVQVRVLMDPGADQYVQDDPYLLLAKEVKRQGGFVIDDPDTSAIMAHKGRFHKILLENHIPVPETVIVSRSELDRFKLTDEIKAQLGIPFVVKPAWGMSSQGVILDGYSEDDLHKSAEQAPNSDSFLIQRRLKPKQLGDHSGWFRLFHVFGEVIACWWDPQSHEYQLVSPVQQQYFKLGRLKSIERSIGRVSKMKFFTSEICLTEEGQFFVVDYLNAEPDMNPRSFYPNGVPDEVILRIVWLLVYYGMHFDKRRHGYFEEELDESGVDWLERQDLALPVRRV